MALIPVNRLTNLRIISHHIYLKASRLSAQSHCQSLSTTASILFNTLSPISPAKRRLRFSADISMNLDNAGTFILPAWSKAAFSATPSPSLMTAKITCAANGFNPARRRKSSHCVSVSIQSGSRLFFLLLLLFGLIGVKPMVLRSISIPIPTLLDCGTSNECL